MKRNIPNLLTGLRILLIPVFLWVYLHAQTREAYLAAALILVFSGLTDTLDGTIARRCDAITPLGKLLDPLADKLTLAAVLCALWVTRPRFWSLYALLIAKELIMLAGGLFLHRKKVVPQSALWFGKLATVMFYVIMVVIVACPALADGAILSMLMILLLFMLFALLQYGRVFRRLAHGESDSV